jgi:predicted acyltransferase (DUF342 family)
MRFDRRTLVIPDNTYFEEHIIVTNGDVIVGDRSVVDFGFKTNGRIFIGESVVINGNIDAENDIRSDVFSVIKGDVRSGNNVYLGEKVRIEGKLSLKGDLDVGDNVEIKEGFEAKGWINIRSPIPLVIYIFIYLLQLLRLGKSEEIERILKELEENENEAIPISDVFLFIPNGSVIGIQKSKVNYNLRIGNNCRVFGNYDIKGSIFIGDNTQIYGSLTATDDINLGKKVRIEGNITSDSEVRIEDKTTVNGNVLGDKIFLSKSAIVNGTLLAKNGVSFIQHTSQKKRMKEKVKRFEKNVDIVDEVKNMLE